MSTPSSRKCRLTLSHAPRGGDAHRLVVVALRPAGGERVAEPEPVGRGDLVGDVGELRGALVRGDDEVGVVAVVADDVRRRDGLGAPVGSGDEVVGDVEQPGDERPVAGDDLVAARLGPAHDEPALGPDRHDHGVLHRLRLDQAEDLGAEVLRPVAPAQAAAGDGAVAQVHALDPRGVDEDLEPGPRGGHVRHRGRVDLERQERALAVVVGAQRRTDHAEETAQDAVGVQAGHRVDQLLDRGQRVVLGVGPRLRVERGVEARREQAQQRPRHRGVRQQRVGHVGHAVAVAELAGVAGVGPQHRDLTPGEPRAQHERAEAVGLRLAPPRRRERRGELRGDLGVRPVGERGLGRDVQAQPEVVGPAAQAVGPDDLRGALVEDVHAELLQHRQHGGQGRRAHRPGRA